MLQLGSSEIISFMEYTFCRHCVETTPMTRCGAFHSEQPGSRGESRKLLALCCFVILSFLNFSIKRIPTVFLFLKSISVTLLLLRDILTLVLLLKWHFNKVKAELYFAHECSHRHDLLWNQEELLYCVWLSPSGKLIFSQTVEGSVYSTHIHIQQIPYIQYIIVYPQKSAHPCRKFHMCAVQWKPTVRKACLQLLQL